MAIDAPIDTIPIVSMHVSKELLQLCKREKHSYMASYIATAS